MDAAMRGHSSSSVFVRARLRNALLEFHRTPGRHSVALKQPPVLFASVREILQIAIGRSEDAIDEELRQAASFFARTALLHPGADHYTLMGLDRSVDGVAIKERYRLLMRLLHPDFSGAQHESWSADAAVRVNIANETLSNPLQRREYDKLLVAGTGVPVAQATQHGLRKPSRMVDAQTHDPRAAMRRLALGATVAGLVLLAIGFFSGGAHEVGQLVQRAPVPRPAAEPAVASREETTAPRSAELPGLVPSSMPSPIPVAQGVSDAPREAASASVTAAPAPALPDPAPRPAQDLAPATAVAAPVVVQQPVISAVAAPAPAPLPQVTVASVEAPAPAKAADSQFAVAAPAPKPSLTLAQAQPLLLNLLQLMEGGRGDRLLDVLERDARRTPAALAFSRRYEALIDGQRSIKLSHVKFNAQPSDGRLMVTGQVRLNSRGQPSGAVGKDLLLRAEFVSREGTVVMTGLSAVDAN